MNGVVLTRNIEPGQTVAASFEAPVLFTLAQDLTQMELHVNVDEADIGKVKEGQKATFSVSAYPNRTFEARITQARYASTTTSGVVTYETVLKVDNTDLSLRPGMTATADITVKKVENAIMVPSAALRFSPPVQQEEKSSTGLVGSLLPRPPRGTQQRNETTTNGKQQRVWICKEWPTFSRLCHDRGNKRTYDRNSDRRHSTWYGGCGRHYYGCQMNTGGAQQRESTSETASHRIQGSNQSLW